MNIKKISLYVLAACLLIGTSTLLVVHTLSEKVTPSPSQLIDQETEWKINRMEEILDKSSNTPLKELPVYSFSEMSWIVGTRYIQLNLNSVGNTLEWFNNVANKAVEYIQKMDDNHIAVVYRVCEQEYTEAYMFAVFQRTIVDENWESWQKTGEAYFFDEVHCFANFAEITIGDSIEKLYELDQSVRYDVLRKESSVNVINSLKPEEFINNPDLVDAPRMIFKLLEDGIMTVEYNTDSSKITEIKFYPYEEDARPVGVSAEVSVFPGCIRTA